MAERTVPIFLHIHVSFGSRYFDRAVSDISNSNDCSTNPLSIWLHEITKFTRHIQWVHDSQSKPPHHFSFLKSSSKYAPLNYPSTRHNALMVFLQPWAHRTKHLRSRLPNSSLHRLLTRTSTNLKGTMNPFKRPPSDKCAHRSQTNRPIISAPFHSVDIPLNTVPAPPASERRIVPFGVRDSE